MNINVICKKTKEKITLIKEFPSSGEGKVWHTSKAGFLAKIYHDPTPERFQKLEVMIAFPPKDPQKERNHVSFAWPTSILVDEHEKNIGFLMPEIKHNPKNLVDICSPKIRKKDDLKIDWHFLHSVSYNIASFIGVLHDLKYVVGDIKPQNILVNSRALPSIIDTDSFQIQDPKTNKKFRCLVGSEGYTPPELLSKNLANFDQTEYQDRFRLAIIIHSLLFGTEPFKGTWTGSGDCPNPDELLRRGYWGYGKDSLIKLGKNSIPLEVVHPKIKNLFLKCFNHGHANPLIRPSAEEWMNALKHALDDLIPCQKVNTHYFHKENLTCYWCERKATTGYDIFEFQRANPIAKSINHPEKKIEITVKPKPILKPKIFYSSTTLPLDQLDQRNFPPRFSLTPPPKK